MTEQDLSDILVRANVANRFPDSSGVDDAASIVRDVVDLVAEVARLREREAKLREWLKKGDEYAADSTDVGMAYARQFIRTVLDTPEEPTK